MIEKIGSGALVDLVALQTSLALKHKGDST